MSRWVTYLTLQGGIIYINNLKMIFLLMPLRSPVLILKTQEMENESWSNPNISHMKSILNGKTACKTTLRQGKQSCAAYILCHHKGYVKSLSQWNQVCEKKISGKSCREKVYQIINECSWYSQGTNPWNWHWDMY